MALFTSTKLESLNDLFVEQLEDLYDAERRLTKALPDMAAAAQNSELKKAFESHRRETEGHVKRLEEVFSMVGRKAKAHTCEAMKGLLTEGREMIEAQGDSNVRDAALIASAQRVEHYEIAGYGSARTFAEQLGHKEAVELLQKTLDEEGAADKTLTQIAERSINWKAAAATA